MFFYFVTFCFVSLKVSGSEINFQPAQSANSRIIESPTKVRRTYSQ